jgi:DnaJ-class molecular chaperone
MASEKYWRIFSDEIAEEILGIALTQTQKGELATALWHHADMEYEATGNLVFDRNLSSARDTELANTKKSLAYEKEKVICRECNGNGYTITRGGSFESQSQCFYCKGEGKIHPSKVRYRA